MAIKLGTDYCLKTSVADPDTEDLGLFGHPDPDPSRAKHQPKSSKIILKNHKTFFVKILS